MITKQEYWITWGVLGLVLLFLIGGMCLVGYAVYSRYTSLGLVYLILGLMVYVVDPGKYLSLDGRLGDAPSLWPLLGWIVYLPWIIVLWVYSPWCVFRR